MRRSPGVLGAAGLKGLTPLLDTVFLLLFALLSVSSARTVQRDETVRVQLPAVEPGTDAGAEPAHRLALEIDATSRLRLANSTAPLTSPDDLDRALATALGDAVPEEIHVEIRADRRARHGTAVALLQHLRLRGYVHVDLLATGSGGEGDLFGDPR